MRYSLEHKARNREKILAMAARSIREHGGDTSGIGTVMKKVGLTKGGFYRRHFASKDDLFVEAVARAFDEMGNGMHSGDRKVGALKAGLCGRSSNAILSTGHADSPGMGCVLAATSGQSSRESRCRCENRIEAVQKRSVS